MPSQGEIVSVAIPFSDLSTAKQRPAVIISNDRYQANTADMVVVALS